MDVYGNMRMEERGNGYMILFHGFGLERAPLLMDLACRLRNGFRVVCLSSRVGGWVWDMHGYVTKEGCFVMEASWPVEDSETARRMRE